MDIRALNKLSVLIQCEGGKSGSGNLIQIKDSYYVLTAAHCLQYKDSKDFYDIHSISVSKVNSDDFKNVKVMKLYYEPELGDIVALEISLGEQERAKLKDAFTKLRIVEPFVSEQFLMCGFLIGNKEWNTYEMKFTGHKIETQQLKFQYYGAPLAIQRDAVAFFKGMSGSGLYHCSDKQIYLTAILVSTDVTSAENNEVFCIDAARFQELLPDLQVISLEKVEERKALKVSETSGMFNLVSESLMQDVEFCKNQFIESKKLQDLINVIRNDDNDAVLIAALSGLGKTRLLFESLKSDYQLSNCFYAQCLDNHSVILSQASNLLSRFKNQLGLLIVDDCDLDVFERLVEIRNHITTSFRIIGTSHDFFEAKRRNIKGTVYLEADEIKADIDNYIDEQLTICDENKNVRDIIKSISEGYPQMAIELIKAYKDGIDPTIDLVDGLMRKLLRFESDDKRMAIMKTLSLCQPMPYENSQKQAFTYMLNSDYFTPLYQNVSDQEREDIAEGLVKKFSPTLIQVQSGWLLVRPFPLAVYLTRQWFEDCSNNRFGNLLREIRNQSRDVQVAICKGFCKHIEQMHGNKSAYELVEKLVVRQDCIPFLNEEVLCSGLGSEFFLAFTHVNPSAVARCIWGLVELKSIDWIKAELVDVARNNIVFALERLCFAKESFYDAFKALSKLAVAENQNRISNNATGQLQQLFHVHLSGTEVDLSTRFSMLQWLENCGEDYIFITLKCIDNAFKSNGFSRMCGSERFGLECRNDYLPKDYQEIQDYWNSVRDILVKVATAYPNVLDEVTTIIENHVFAWFRDHLFEMAYSLIYKVVELRHGQWDTLYNNLSRDREYYISNIPDTEKEAFEKLLKTLRPNRFIASLNDARHAYWAESYKLRGEELSNLAKKYFNPLVEEFISHHFYENEEELTLLMDDKEYIDQVFINSLEKEMSSDMATSMFGAMFEILKKKEDGYSSEFMLSVCRSFRHSQICKSFISNVRNLGFHILYIKLIAGNDIDTIDGYTQLKAEYGNPDDFLDNYLRFFQSYDDKLYCELIKRVMSDFPNCKNTLVHFLLQRKYFVKDYLLIEAGPLVKELLLGYNCGSDCANDMYEYSSFLIDVFNSFRDTDFAFSVCCKFIELYNTTLKHLNLDRVLPALLEHYADVVWDKIAEALVSKDYILFYEQAHIGLGSGYGFGAGPLFSLPDSEQRIQKLCLKYRDRAPICIAKMVPCYHYHKEGDKIQVVGFSSYFIWLLEQFGEDRLVRSGLHSNLNSFSWTGSIISYYEQNIFCYKQLLDMPSMPDSVKKWSVMCIKQCEEFRDAELEKETYMKFCYGYKY